MIVAQPIATIPSDVAKALVFGWPWGEVYGRQDAPGWHVAQRTNGKWTLCGTEYYPVEIQDVTHWAPLPDGPQP